MNVIKRMRIIPEGLDDGEGHVYRPAEYNPRIDLQPGDKGWEKLRKSLETFEDNSILVVNSKTGNLVGGHQRLKVMRYLGWQSVDVRVRELTTQMEKALNAALNNPEIGGDWDYEKLPTFLRSLDDDVLPLTGWDDSQLKSMMRDDSLLEGIGQGFASTVSDTSNEFAMTFVFPKTEKGAIDSYVKEYGKDAIVEAIIELVKKE